MFQNLVEISRSDIFYKVLVIYIIIYLLIPQAVGEKLEIVFSASTLVTVLLLFLLFSHSLFVDNIAQTIEAVEAFCCIHAFDIFVYYVGCFLLLDSENFRS